MQVRNLERLPIEYRELIGEYYSALKDHFRDRLVSMCVFGSVAKGEATPESDVDVLLVVDGLPEDMGFRIRQTLPLRLRLGEGKGYKHLKELGRSGSISEVIFTPPEIKRHPPILLDVVEDGIILHDRGRFLRRNLDSIAKRLEELGARKVVTEKGYFWILKPDLRPGEVVEI